MTEENRAYLIGRVFRKCHLKVKLSLEGRDCDRWEGSGKNEIWDKETWKSLVDAKMSKLECNGDGREVQMRLERWWASFMGSLGYHDEDPGFYCQCKI